MASTQTFLHARIVLIAPISGSDLRTPSILITHFSPQFDHFSLESYSKAWINHRSLREYSRTIGSNEIYPDDYLDQDLPVQLVTETLNWINLVEEPISEVKRLDNKLKRLLSRIEGLYNMMRDLNRRVNSTVNRLTSVLRLYRRIEVMVRMLTMVIHRLRKFLYPPYTKWLT